MRECRYTCIHAVRSARVLTPHYRSQHIQANTRCGSIQSVLLTMGIMMPETCWVNLKWINILYLCHPLVLSSPTLMMHSHTWAGRLQNPKLGASTWWKTDSPHPLIAIGFWGRRGSNWGTLMGKCKRKGPTNKTTHISNARQQRIINDQTIKPSI